MSETQEIPGQGDTLTNVIGHDMIIIIITQYHFSGLRCCYCIITKHTEFLTTTSS